MNPVPNLPYKIKLLLDIIQNHCLSAEECKILAGILLNHAYFKEALNPVGKMLTDLEVEFKAKKGFELGSKLDFTE